MALGKARPAEVYSSSLPIGKAFPGAGDLTARQMFRDRPNKSVELPRAEDGQIAVSVSDTGVGLPPLPVNQIFNAFFTTKPHSVGIGLSISRSIVEEHGGHLWATNNSSRGANFHLTLPIEVQSPADHGP
jgi:signal transduction histidine kinase